MLIYHYTFLFHIFSLLTIHFSLITIPYFTIPYFTMTSIGFCRVRVRPSGPTTVTREI